MGKRETVDEQVTRIRREAEEKRAQIEDAKTRISPVSLDSGHPASCITTKAQFRVVDDFLAVVDGRENLPKAMKLARSLIHDFESVVVVRERSEKDISKSHRAMSKSFNMDMFGGGQPEAYLFPRSQQNKYIYYRPTLASFQQYKNKRFGFFARRAFGEDIDALSRAVGEAFPEYLNTTVKRNSSINNASKPGWIHTDGPFKVEELMQHHFLPKKLVKVIEKEKPDILPGEATITMVLNDRDPCSDKDENPLSGAGTILFNSRQNLKGKFFQEAKDAVGHQVRDGDIPIIRGEGWPVHPVTQKPRLAGNHAASMDNRFGVNNHGGRMLALATSKVCYVHPRVRDLLELRT